MTPKQYYQSYIADDNLSQLNLKLIEVILENNPGHVFEFGCGSGKNLKLIHDKGIVTAGLDISFMNVNKSVIKHELPFMMIGDEAHLGHLTSFDVVFTISVLDHIEDISEIIKQFKRIANKSIFLAETNDTPGQFYYPHIYEDFGFVKLDYYWVSPSDGGTYYIWKYDVKKNKAE